MISCKEKDFDKLVASIKEAGEIRAGRQAPSRVYEIEPPEIKTIRDKLPAKLGAGGAGQKKAGRAGHCCALHQKIRRQFLMLYMRNRFNRQLNALDKVSISSLVS
ncbi:hypothetical protein QUF72_17205 [Desulfobacterales bacterium HSG2]|nr:hypothetical protein [Desulfobacterales bacterium HSG2]